MEKRKISSKELAVGTVLTFDAYDDQGRLLLRRGEVITSASQVEGLMERGLFVMGSAEPKPVAKEAAPPSAVALILDARRRLEIACVADLSAHRFPERIRDIGAMVVDACRLSPEVAHATLLLERTGRYSIRHSVDVAIASYLVASSLATDEEEVKSIVCAGLTMNIAFLDLQDELQEQKAPLTSEQRAAVLRHPDESARLLRARGVTDELWLDAVLSHHEAIDGSGYRSGRKGDDIPVPAQLLYLADLYCARISSRKYRRALRPNAALKSLFLDQGKKVRDGLASQFIKTVGVFPTGTPVRLESGEIAVVTQHGAKGSTPLVSAIVGTHGMPLAIPVKRDTSAPGFGVREVLEWEESCAIPRMQTLWGKIAAAN